MLEEALLVRWLPALLIVLAACKSSVGVLPDAAPPAESSAPAQSDAGVDAASGTALPPVPDAASDGGDEGTGLTHADAGGTDAASSSAPECAAHADCEDAARPQCGAMGACEPCTADAACEPRSTTPRCDSVETSPTLGQCVQCVQDLDCDAETPRCGSARACEACATSADCEGRAETPVCDDGSCVGCSGVDYDCGLGAGNVPRVCDSIERTCTTKLERSADVCDPCVSDAQCKLGLLCVAQSFDAPHDVPDQGPVEVGLFCLWRRDAATGPGGDCAAVRPYVESDVVESVDGFVADMCALAVTSCPALQAFGDTCAPTATDTQGCGDPEVELDGVCVTTASMPTVHSCSLWCAADDDCPNGHTCAPVAGDPQTLVCAP